VYLAAIVLAIGTGAHFAFQLSRAGQPSFFLWIAGSDHHHRDHRRGARASRRQPLPA